MCCRWPPEPCSGGSVLDFQVWKLSITEDVRVANRLLDKVFVGKSVCGKIELWLDVRANAAFTVCSKKRIQGPNLYSYTADNQGKMAAVQVAIRDSDVDELVCSMDGSGVSEEQTLQESLHRFLCGRRDLFTELGKIKSVRHVAALKTDAKPV